MNRESFDLALYDAFSDRRFGGSQAAVVSDAASINRETRQRLAREIGMPATAFVDACGDDWIQVQFMSAVMELPMCGHGSICLLTRLFESGVFGLAGNESRSLELRLPAGSAQVEVSRRADGRYRVMLEIKPPVFEAPPPHSGELLQILGLGADSLSSSEPLETARGDFIHLVVPLRDLAAIRAIKPDFGGMVDFCHAHGIETIAVFCRDVENPDMDIHVRDFCPAVGVSESAAAGTTNAALGSYLVRHGLLAFDGDIAEVNAEQGLELGRPSSIQSLLHMQGGEITGLQVGGVATRVLDGRVYL